MKNESDFHCAYHPTKQRSLFIQLRNEFPLFYIKLRKVELAASSKKGNHFSKPVKNESDFHHAYHSTIQCSLFIQLRNEFPLFYIELRKVELANVCSDYNIFPLCLLSFDR